MKNLKLFLLLLIFSSCDVSTLAGKDVNNLSKYKATILIETDNKKEDLRQIKVYLSDGDNQVINDEVKIRVNNIPMNLYVHNDLYYTKTSFYTTDSLSKKASYYFEMILPDSTKHALAFIKPLKENELTKFSIPDSTSKSQSFTLKWSHLFTPYRLHFMKRFELPESDNSTSTSYDNGITIDTLRTKNGTYTIPELYFTDSKNNIDELSLTLSREETGLINTKLINGSSLIFSHNISKNVVVY